tara:strand:+ start:483 stop:983 length:501 start_codon:yes stop_codon:yes gene_type:complete
MDLLQKPTLFQNVCEIQLATQAVIKPAPFGSLQPFSNTYVDTTTAVPVHFGRSSVALAQEGKSTIAGMLYEQQLKLRFPNSDLLQSARIQEYQKVKFVYVKMSDGLVFFLGRNDYFQNAPIVSEIKNTPNIVEITYKTTSIFPIGLTNGAADHLLGEDIPINFFNL